MPEDIRATIGGTASLESQTEDVNAEINVSQPSTGVLSAEFNPYGTLEINDVNSQLKGNIAVTAGKNVEAFNSNMAIRLGIDGRDGVSPTIEEHVKTPTEYILKITDVNGSFLTPNLIPDISSIGPLDSKVSCDLGPYELIEPKNLSQSIRERTYIYAYSDGKRSKLSFGDIALTSEVDKKIKTKIRTLDSHPADSRVGDYVFIRKNS